MAVGSKDLNIENLAALDNDSLGEALTRAAHKLPMKCRIVKREAGEA